jgi:AbiTii-like protein
MKSIEVPYSKTLTKAMPLATRHLIKCVPASGNALDDPPAEIVSIAPPTALVGILETVRMVILNWTLKLEEDGILGEGLSFSSSEKQTASEHTYNRVVPQ